MEINILDLEVGREGAGRPVTIKDVRVREIENKFGRISRMAQLITVTHDGYEYDISAAFMMNDQGELEKRTLFLDLDAEGKIRADSALAAFLGFFGMKTPRDLIGRDIVLRTNSQGHLLAVALRDKAEAA